MSPNSTERADVITVSTFVYSLAPTILGFLVPILAGFTGGLEHINAYRIIMPIFGIGGALIGLLHRHQGAHYRCQGLHTQGAVL